ADGTAIAGTDYTATSGTLTFDDGEYLKTVAIPILDDSSFEPTKTFTITLSNPTGGATLESGTEAVVSIFDDDGPGTFHFSSPSYVVNENDRTATITVNRSGGAVGAASVDFATTNATAKDGTDYVGTSGTLNFANGEFTKTFTVTILDDAIIEGIEGLN